VTDADIYAALTDIFRETFMNDSMAPTPTLSAEDVKGWDSFKQIEIVIATEARFGIKMSTRDLDSLHNVGDLAQVVAMKTAVA
jgi:acyl carrier protein